ncbi:MAG: HAD family hydrolase [Candidatus Sericytochromatia bacterium]|nr:HAD family hydrolase [Candidatus Sericytochromatia bacterium]
MTIDTLMFDLDGTLVDQFHPGSSPQFALLLMRRFRGLTAPAVTLRAALGATRLMKRHTSDRTNFEVVITEFARRTGIPYDEVAKRFLAFSQHDFPAMKWRFRPIPGAREAILLGKELGFRMVLATNPAVPLSMIQHRVNWAGLGDISWDVITHQQIMRRLKPSVDYYRHLLELVDRPAEQCLMVGNDYQMDTPAMSLGIKTFLVDRPMNRKQGRVRSVTMPDWLGTYADLATLIRQLGQELATAPQSV